MSGPVLVRTPPRQAPWKQIPEAMRSLWRACLPDAEGGDVARSLTINFVGVAAAADADALAAATERLQRRTPCRAFLLLLDDAARPGVADLAATTRCTGDLRDIVLEEITMRLPRAALPQVPGLVRPLLMNDLPNHLFWAAPWPAAAADFDGLAALCDHAIVDSRRFADPAGDLAAVLQRRAAGLRLTDLTWLRLRPMRRALAEAFERVAWSPGTPATARLRHGRAAHAAARLLADWLGARLAAAVTLEAGGDDGAALPDEVVLQTGGFEIALTGQRQQIRVHVTTPEHCYLPFAVPTSRGSDGDLLAAAIDLG